MAYLDNIIIYLNSVEEHKKYIKWVLRKLYKENMPVTVEKCKFYTKKTNFVGFIIELGQISMDLKKIKAIVNWQDLKSVIGLKSFLGFCNYYHKFIAK
jgi:ribosome-interacting GTPase 1